MPARRLQASTIVSRSKGEVSPTAASVRKRGETAQREFDCAASLALVPAIANAGRDCCASFEPRWGGRLGFSYVNGYASSRYTQVITPNRRCYMQGKCRFILPYSDLTRTALLSC